MKVSKLLGQRFKDAPSDCVIESHALMQRGGYMKYMANGIYSLFMPGRRITRKIENIQKSIEIQEKFYQDIKTP